MTYLHALSAGSRMATDRFSGAVHSVFPRACNIVLDQGSLISLLAEELGNVPHAARLAVPAGFGFDTALHRGERVACERGLVRFAATGLAVQLGGARRWAVSLDDLALDMSRPHVDAAWHLARRMLDQRCRERPCGDAGLATLPLAALQGAARGLNAADAGAAVQHMIGCGIGLTPAGDDVLVGFLAGLRSAAGDDASRRLFLNALGDVVSAAAAGTNPLSRAFLRDACAGAFPERLAVVAERIAAGAPGPSVAAATDKALAAGATSGADGVRGLLDAMRCWQ